MDAGLSKKIRNISFLLILLVALIHGNNINLTVNTEQNSDTAIWLVCMEEFFSDGICRIAVPFFFAISGFLCVCSLKENYSPRAFLSLIRKRLISLLIPYLIISLSGILLIGLIQSFPATRSFINSEVLWKLPVRSWLYRWLVDPLQYQFWFVRLLMGFILIFPFLYYLIKQFMEDVLIILGIIWVFIPFLFFSGLWRILICLPSAFFWILSGGELIDFPRISKLEVEGLFFFSIGIYAAVARINLVDEQKKWPLKLVAVFWLAWISYRTWLVIAHPGFHYTIHFHLIGITLSGFFLFWYLYDHFRESIEMSVWIATAAPYTFGIFLFHEPALTIVKKSLIHLFGTGNLSFASAYWLSPGIAVLFSFWISDLLNRNCPACFRLITGNRQISRN